MAQLFLNGTKHKQVRYIQRSSMFLIFQTTGPENNRDFGFDHMNNILSEIGKEKNSFAINTLYLLGVWNFNTFSGVPVKCPVVKGTCDTVSLDLATRS